MSFRKKNLPRLAICIVSLSIFFLCVTFFITTKADSSNMEQTNQILSDAIYTEMMKKFNDAIVVSKMMAADDFFIKFIKNEGDLKSDSEQMSNYLNTIKEKFGFAQVNFISAKTYRYYRDDEMHKIISPSGDAHDVWFNLFEQDGKKATINLYRHKNGLQASRVYINCRVEDENGKFLGVTSPALYADDVLDYIAKLEKKYNVKINTTDSNGTVYLDSTFSEIYTASLYHLIAGRKQNQFKKTGVSSFYATYYIPDFDWFLIVRSTSKSSIRDYNVIFYYAALFILICDLLILTFAKKLSFDKQKNYVISNEQIDALTGLPNRNYFKEQFGERGLFNTTAYKCMAVFDIDYFKEAADNMNGDDALISIVNTMKSELGNHGIMLRWGGDEFVVLFDLPLENAYKICRNFCQAIADGGLITVSIGLTKVELFDTIKNNYHRAARYCYMVKELGGNGVKKD